MSADFFAQVFCKVLRNFRKPLILGISIPPSSGGCSVDSFSPVSWLSFSGVFEECLLDVVSTFGVATFNTGVFVELTERRWLLNGPTPNLSLWYSNQAGLGVLKLSLWWLILQTVVIRSSWVRKLYIFTSGLMGKNYRKELKKSSMKGVSRCRPMIFDAVVQIKCRLPDEWQKVYT